MALKCDSDKWMNAMNLMLLLTALVIEKYYKVALSTRTPVFWDTPAAPWLPILVIHIRSHVITRVMVNAEIPLAA